MHNSSLNAFLMVPMAPQCCHMIGGWAHTKKGSLFFFISYFVVVTENDERCAWYVNFEVFVCIALL